MSGMKRDPNSKAIVFAPNPEKQKIKEARKRVEHHSKEIQFLADCINFQQGLIDNQNMTIEELRKKGTVKNKVNG